MTTHRSRLLLHVCTGVLVLAIALVVGFGSRCHAGEDDFDYARSLAELGMKTGDQAYFDYARRVFDGVINDPNRSEADKDECRYGLADMKKNEAIGATGNPAIKYPEVLKLFQDAVGVMESFVKKNPDHKRANEARLAVGTTRLGFVQWARDSLLSDREEAMEKGASDLTKVQADARDMVRGAIEYFDKLRVGHDKVDATQLSEISQYYWVLCQYYLALVEEPGSSAAKEALDKAAKDLDAFITLNDGKLLAIYAQDIFGLTRWEQAKQAGSEEEREKYYGRAVEWFETCIETEVTSPDEERVVANGYYHLGQVCFEAGRVGTRNFHREASTFLKDMESRYATIWRQDNGIRALLEWAKIENAQEHQSEAVEILRRAGAYAKKLGKGWLEQQANRLLRKILAGPGSSLGTINAEPSVLMRVASDFYSEQKWDEAIRAYQQVIGSVKDRTEKSVTDFLIPSWERIAAAYKAQGDLMASALALEPIHDIWMDGLVKKVGGPDDPNMINLGNIRLRAQVAWKELYDETGSSLYRDRMTEIRNGFNADYPDHPSGRIGQWNQALDKMKQALKEQQEKSPRWRSTMGEADELFQQVANDKGSERQDAAWVYLVYTQVLRDDWNGAMKAADKAMAFWNSPAALAQAKQFPSIAQRRKPEMGKALYWKAEAQYRLERWDDVLKTLDGWHVEYDELRTVDDGRYYSGALGQLVFAYIGKGDIPSADTQFKRLLAVDPKYRLLPKITFALAKHFNDEARRLDDERKQARARLNGSVENPDGARPKLRKVLRDESRTVGYLVDVENKLSKLQDLVNVYDKRKAEGLPTSITEKEYEDAKKEIPEVEKEITRLREEANKLTAEREGLEKEVAELVETIKRLAQELYDPLTRAADYFWQWDDVLKRSKLDRDAGNVNIFADLYYKAGLLRPEEEENWARARSLYEDYLKMEGTPKDKRQEAVGRLGTIYSRLAARAKPGSEDRARLVQKALDRMQGSMANLPENNDLVLGLLNGDVVIIPWRKGTEATNRFPLPRISSVDAFKKAVDSLGKPGGAPIPVFEADRENRRYENALRDFKVYVQGLSDGEIDRTVKGFENAGFDISFFRELAESGLEFRLSMAWIYTESGLREHMVKGYNLASSVASGRYAAEENSEEWWAAQVIRLRALVQGAELELREAGAQTSPTAKDWAERASKMLRGLNTSNPDLGDDVRPETRDELKELNRRIDLLRGQVGLKRMDLVLDKIPGINAPPANGGGDEDK